MTETTVFAVCLGGRAPKGNTELHDVVFVAGETVEATYGQLLSKWFGQPEDLHIDSWRALTAADGHRIRLGAPTTGGKRLYYVNLGAYADGSFAEVHANGLFVAASTDEAKARAKAELLKGWPDRVHTDDIIDVEAALALPGVGLVLEPRDGAAAPAPVNAYHPIPEDAVAAFRAGN